MDINEIRQRLEDRAREAARDGETATVVVQPASDLPAWSAEVTWTGANGIREWAGYKGRLEDLEQHVIMTIAAQRPATNHTGMRPRDVYECPRGHKTQTSVRFGQKPGGEPARGPIQCEGKNDDGTPCTEQALFKELREVPWHL